MNISPASATANESAVWKAGFYMAANVSVSLLRYARNTVKTSPTSVSKMAKNATAAIR
jgi:hypothetical protein